MVIILGVLLGLVGFYFWLKGHWFVSVVFGIVGGFASYALFYDPDPMGTIGHTGNAIAAFLIFEAICWSPVWGRKVVLNVRKQLVEDMRKRTATPQLAVQAEDAAFADSVQNPFRDYMIKASEVGFPKRP